MLSMDRRHVFALEVLIGLGVESRIEEMDWNGLELGLSVPQQDRVRRWREEMREDILFCLIAQMEKSCYTFSLHFDTIN